MSLFDRAYSQAIQTRVYRDDARLIIARHQNIAPIMEANKQMRNQWSNASDAHRHAPEHGTFVARIPLGTVEAWIKEGFNMFQASDAEIARRLNLSDNTPLRVVPGKV